MSSIFTLPDTLPLADIDTESLEAALTELVGRRPGISATIRPFAELFGTSRKADALLSGWTAKGMPDPDPAKLGQGVPWLADDSLTWIDDQGAAVAGHVLPAIGAVFPAVAAECGRMLKAIREGRVSCSGLVRLLLDNDAAGLDSMAAWLDVRTGLLVLAVREIGLPLLRKAARLRRDEISKVQWLRGCCPCCGSLPSAAFLSRRNERNAEFLAGGGGQRVLLCSRCEHRWTTKRVMCPVCETEDPEAIEYVKVSEGRGERVYLCGKCNSYVPCLDLREAADVTALEIEPLGLVHLDILARKRGYSPAAPLPWNALELPQ